jgi:ribosomal-protein-serine acetyltransferase
MMEEYAMFTFVVNSEIELRILVLRDAEEVFQQVDKNREYLSRWLPWANNSKLEDTKGFIQSIRLATGLEKSFKDEEL